MILRLQIKISEHPEGVTYDGLTLSEAARWVNNGYATIALNQRSALSQKGQIKM